MIGYHQHHHQLTLVIRAYRPLLLLCPLDGIQGPYRVSGYKFLLLGQTCWNSWVGSTHGGVSTNSVMAKVLDCIFDVGLNSNRAIMFTFELMPFEKAWTPLIAQ